MANIRRSRRSGFTTRGGRSVRESLWFDGPVFNTNMGAASTAVLVSSLSAAALALRPFTVVRTRGSMFLETDQQAASEFYQAAIGCCVVSDQAVAIGVTAVPTPFTDQSSDLWYVYEVLMGKLRVGTPSPVELFESGIFKDYDSKAMRKVEEGQDLIAVIETSSISLGCTMGHSSRTLIKLH